MDITLIIELIAAIVVAYLLVKFIVSPAIKIIAGIIVFIILLYILQKFFGFNFDKLLSPLGISVPFSLDWIFDPIDYIVNQITAFFHAIFKNIPIKK